MIVCGGRWFVGTVGRIRERGLINGELLEKEIAVGKADF